METTELKLSSFCIVQSVVSSSRHDRIREFDDDASKHYVEYGGSTTKRFEVVHFANEEEVIANLIDREVDPCKYSDGDYDGGFSTEVLAAYINGEYRDAKTIVEDNLCYCEICGHRPIAKRSDRFCSRKCEYRASEIACEENAKWDAELKAGAD